MDERNNGFDFDFMPIGQAIKKARKAKGMTREELAELTNLIPEVLDMVDNSVLKEKDKLQMALRPAVELSYLTEVEQRALLETMSVEECTPSHAQAIKMRDFSEKGNGSGAGRTCRACPQ